jgi:cell division protein FtsI (penicillin-binding protein 3)
VKLVREKLSPSDEYSLLRDLGFGAPTGVPYLGESSGRLPTTDKWTKWTWAQVATGYEVMATPLQLAQAYTALANGGEIVEPALIAEIRDAEERPVWRHTPRTVRRVMTPRTTAIVNAMLESVVDSGTAKAAGLSSYAVSGKSGTARRAIGKQGYVPGHYNSSFIALFPADQPQLVVVSRMIDATVPNNYGGATAGTVVREVLRNTLALPDILDRRTLREAPRPVPPLAAARDSSLTRSSDGALASASGRDSAAVDTVRRAPRVLPAPPTAGTFVMQWPAAPTVRSATPRAALVAVPDVRGLSVRDATRLLHAAGLRVALADGRGAGTTPGAGAMVRSGSVVRLPLEP